MFEYKGDLLLSGHGQKSNSQGFYRVQYKGDPHAVRVRHNIDTSYVSYGTCTVDLFSFEADGWKRIVETCPEELGFDVKSVYRPESREKALGGGRPESIAREYRIEEAFRELDMRVLDMLAQVICP